MMQSARSVQRRDDFGLAPREAAFLRRLTPEWKIQRFLDAIDYDVHTTGCRSPRRVLRERRVQCLDGALFAAAALRRDLGRVDRRLFAAGIVGRQT